MHAAPTALPAGLPELLRMAVDKALEKEPGDRYQTMQDFVADLKRAARKSGSQTAIASGPPRHRALTVWLAGAAFGAALSAAIAVAALRLLRTLPAPALPMHFTIPVVDYAAGGLSISPDGRRITYASTANGTRQLRVRPLDAVDARAIPGTDGAGGVFWSPDSRRIAFSANGKLERMNSDGGPAQPLADVSSLTASGSWSRSGTILYFTGNDLALLTAEDRSIAWPEPRDPGVAARVHPHMLPDDDHFLYVGIRPAEKTPTQLFAGSLTTLKSKPLTVLATQAGPPQPTITTNLAYAHGYLLYLLGSGGGLMAVSFDAAALAVRGDLQLLAANVAEFAVSSDVLVYREQTAGNAATVGTRELTWVNRRGEPVGRLEAPALFRAPILSPDGRRVALAAPDAGGFTHVWTIDTDRGTPARLTFDNASDGAAIWSPDGTELVFASGLNNRVGQPRIPSVLYRRAANGTGTDQLLFAGEGDELLVPFGWSPDGHLLLFGRGRFAGWQQQMDLWTLEVTGEHQARPLVTSPGRKSAARLSPNGRWMVYSTNESNETQIVVQPFPNVDQGRWQISAHGGGDDPQWRADGRELYYLGPNGDLMAVDVDTSGKVFAFGTPHKLFATRVMPAAPPEQPDYYYDAMPDGQKFLINEPVSANSSQTGQSAVPAPPELPLNVIVNWSAGLHRP